VNFVNLVDISPEAIRRIAASPHDPRPARVLAQVDPSALLVDSLLSDADLGVLREQIDRLCWQPVGVSGIASEYSDGDPIGSWRASVFNEKLAGLLWHRLRTYLPELRAFDAKCRTDWDGHALWRPVGINPLLRLIRYRDAGLLVPHYDAPYVESAERRTLTTLVVYLACDDDVVGGETRFIADPQRQIEHDRRDYSDWTRVARPDEIIASVEPLPGSALVFDHRIQHDSAPLTAPTGSKIILRTDVIYERA
jgi:hypothetical protein